MPRESPIGGTILSVVKQLVHRKSPHAVEPDELTPLGRGLGLDSLDWAEIVVRLEDELGVDPFANGVVESMATLGDLIEVYEKALATH